MPQWTHVADVDDLPPGSAKELVAGDRIIALYHVDGQFYALDGVCPHQGGPLGKGALCGRVVTCPWHGWQFDVASGQHQFSPTIVQPTYLVRIEAGQVLVDLDSGPRMSP